MCQLSPEFNWTVHTVFAMFLSLCKGVCKTIVRYQSRERTVDLQPHICAISEGTALYLLLLLVGERC